MRSESTEAMRAERWSAGVTEAAGFTLPGNMARLQPLEEVE
jgi:hypothetical protein